MDYVAIVGAVVGPLVGLATLYLNLKFNAKLAEKDAEIADLSKRLDACEARHAANDAKEKT